MAVVRRLEGVVRLPPELIAEESLGQTFAGRVSGSAFELTYPRLPDPKPDDVVLGLQSPYHVEQFVSDAIASGVGGWGQTAFLKGVNGQRRSLASWVNYCALRIREDVGGPKVPFYDLADQFGRRFNEWYACALDWVDLWRGIVFSRNADWSVGTQGYLREVEISYPGGLTGWGGDGFLPTVHILPSKSAIRRHVLMGAFGKATANESPPAEWVLYLRSHRASDARIAVIEAATATEVGLARALAGRLVYISARARQTVAKQANGLVGLLTLIESIDGVAKSDSLAERVKDQMAGPRNNAVHRGTVPEGTTVAQKALATAKAVLERYSPLPRPFDNADHEAD